VTKWRTAPDKYDPKNKKEDDIRYAYAHNLALAAYLTGDIEAADSGIKAGFDWGKNSSWYQDLRRTVSIENTRKRQNNRAWKPTKFVDVFQLQQPEFRRLKVMPSGPIKPASYLVSRDTVYTSFRFAQMEKGKELAEIHIADDTEIHKYNPLQMQAIFDGTHFYEAMATPLAGNTSFGWRVVKVEANFKNGTIKLGSVEHGTPRKEDAKTLPEEHIIFGSGVRRAVNLSGPDFAADFNAGVVELFGAEYPEIAGNAKTGKYTATLAGYKALAVDLAAVK
jgi:hypothetical protein